MSYMLSFLEKEGRRVAYLFWFCPYHHFSLISEDHSHSQEAQANQIVEFCNFVQ